jgi:hypothetical protein
MKSKIIFKHPGVCFSYFHLNNGDCFVWIQKLGVSCFETDVCEGHETCRNSPHMYGALFDPAFEHAAYCSYALFHAEM